MEQHERVTLLRCTKRVTIVVMNKVRGIAQGEQHAPNVSIGVIPILPYYGQNSLAIETCRPKVHKQMNTSFHEI